MCPRTMSIIGFLLVNGDGDRLVVGPSEDLGVVAGVDGCPGGWVCFEIDLGSRRTSVAITPTLAVLLERSPRPSLVAIDIPIGLPLKGARACDIGARKLLGKPRSSSVFPAPVRATLAARTYEEACKLSRDAQGKSLSRQTFEILAKIREVDDLITPNLQKWIFEVHPELSFWALNGRLSLKYGKSKREGKEERRKLLLPHYPEIQSHLTNLDRSKATPDDLLDAAAAAWTAECVARGIVPR